MSNCMDQEREHEPADWKWVRDWYGNPDIPNGTQDCSHYQCIYCGEEFDPDTDIEPEVDY